MSATLASQDGACPFPPDLKFLGFLLTDGFRIAVAEESVERFKQKVREEGQELAIRQRKGTTVGIQTRVCPRNPRVISSTIVEDAALHPAL